MSKIFEAIPKIMSEVGAIEKTRRNQQGSGYMFRGIDDVYGALQPLLHKYGVFFVPTVMESVREERASKSGGNLIYTVLKVQYTFFADDGSSFVALVTGEAMDSGDKSSNKAMSAALKYVLLQVFCIPTEEEKDTEYHSPEVAPKTVQGVRPPLPKSQAAAVISVPAANAMSAARAAPAPKITPSTHPRQPDPEDGNQGMFDKGYMIDFGKWSKRSLSEVHRNEGPEAIMSYCAYLEENARKQGKTIEPNSKPGIFIREAESFLGTIENSGNIDQGNFGEQF